MDVNDHVGHHRGLTQGSTDLNAQISDSFS